MDLSEFLEIICILGDKVEQWFHSNPLLQFRTITNLLHTVQSVNQITSDVQAHR